MLGPVGDTPIDVPEILARFSGEVRLFPLPSLVLFPDAFAPLKVFEPRYIAMVREAMGDDHLIATALLKPGHEEEYAGNPPIHPVVCVGRILRSQETTGGKYDVVLYGLFRARITEEIPSTPFRRARVALIQDRSPRSRALEIARQMRRAIDLVPGRHAVVWEMRRIANQLRGVDAGAGRYADALANACDLQPGERYELLAEPDVRKRFLRLIELLTTRLADEAPPATSSQDPALN
jgi:Lon protease-like protein